MKKLIGYHGILLLLAFSITLSISCEKEDNIVEAPEDTDSSQVQEDDPQEEVEEGSESEVDPDLVTASLVLDNMKIINGTPPDSGKKAKAYNDLKIDYDTIFWTTGITKRIKIKKPLGVSLNNGVRVYVPGADSYIEASLRDDEASDEVGVLYFDFKHTDWNYLSITFPLEISPLDENGNPIDVFSVPAVIEEPYANNGGNNGSGGGCNIDLEGYYWEWAYYKSDNPQFFTGLWFPHLQLSTTNGCCIDGESIPNTTCSAANTKELDYEIIFMRPSLFMFFSGQKVNVFGQLSSTNLDPSASDFCTNSAGYTTSNVSVIKAGDYSINADCSISFENFVYEGDSFLVDPTLYIGGGSQIKYTLISDHFMEQTISGSGGDGGGSGEFVASVFERKRELDGQDSTWYD